MAEPPPALKLLPSASAIMYWKVSSAMASSGDCPTGGLEPLAAHTPTGRASEGAPVDEADG